MATAKKVTPITAAPSAGKAKPGTAVAVKPKTGSNIVSIQEQLRAQAAEVGSRTQAASGNAIRVTQDKHLLLPDGQKVQELDVVIVDFATQHKFYEANFDPKAITPPACFAIGSNPNNMAPSPNAPIAQSTNCQGCPMNQFGSASSGEGKACKNSRVMAVLPPDAGEDDPLWTLATSPTANKGFDGMVQSIARIFQTPPVGSIVTVSFDPSETYAKLVFSNPRVNPNVADHFARQAEAKEMVTREPDVSQFVAAAPKKQVAGKRR
jgi:hypothetical protein